MSVQQKKKQQPSRQVRRKNQVQQENDAIVKKLEEPDPGSELIVPKVESPFTYERSSEALDKWLETRKSVVTANLSVMRETFFSKMTVNDVRNLSRNLDVLEWAIRHDTLNLDERKNTFNLARMVRHCEDKMEKDVKLGGDARVDTYEIPLTTEGNYQNSPIRNLLVLESAVLHEPLTRILFSKLHEEGYTPNLQRVLGVQFDRNAGFGLRPAAPKLLIYAEPLTREPTVYQFLTRDSPLRERLGLPSEEAVRVNADEDVYFVGDTETGRRVHDFFSNMMHQVLLTLAVIQEQASSMLVDISFDNLLIQDLSQKNQAPYTASRLVGQSTIAYRLEGKDVLIPNLGFLVKISFLGASSSKFDLTRFPSRDGTVRFPYANKFFLARRPDVWGETFSWRQALLDLVLPLGVREYSNFYSSINFNPALDIVILLNSMRLESLWFINKLALLRNQLDLETMMHLLYFGNLRRLEYKTVDESLLLSVIKKTPDLYKRGVNGKSRGVITGALLKPTTYTLVTANRFLAHSLFAKARSTPYEETGTHYLYLRWFPITPSLTKALFGNLTRYGDNEMLDLSGVKQASNGIEQLRKWIFNDTYRLESLFGDSLVLSSILLSVDKKSASFINQGSQGIIFRTKVTKTITKANGETMEQQLPAALKSYRGAKSGMSATTGLIGSNILSAPEVVNELLISVIVSWMYETGKSPNFIETFSIFTMQYAERKKEKTWRQYLTRDDLKWKDMSDFEVLIDATRTTLIEIMNAFREKNFLYMEKFIELVMTETQKAIDTLPKGVTRASDMKIKKAVIKGSLYETLLANLRRDSQQFRGVYATSMPWVALLLTALRFYDEDVPAEIILYATSQKIFAEETTLLGTPESYAPVQSQDEIPASEEDEAAAIDASGGNSAIPPADATEYDLEHWYFTNDVIERIIQAFDVWKGTADTVKNMDALLQMSNDEDVHFAGSKAYLITELIDGDMSNFRKFVGKIQAGLLKVEKKPFDQVPSFDEYVTNAIAQITFSLALYHDYFNGMHADLHPGNIFLKYCDETTYYDGRPLSEHMHFHYEVRGKTYRVPNMGFIVKIADMGHATVALSKDLAPVDSKEVKLSPEETINRRIVHKEVVGKDWKNLKKSVVDVLAYLADKFGANYLVMPSFNVIDIVDKLLKGEWIRDSGFFYEAFDFTTLFNNMQGDRDFYSTSLVTAWVSFEKEKEREKYGTEEFFARYWPSTYLNYWKNRSFSIYLPRTTKNVVTPHLFIERFLGIYSDDNKSDRAQMSKRLAELAIYGSLVDTTPRCSVCRHDAAIFDETSRLAFCSKVCQGDAYLAHQLRTMPTVQHADFISSFLRTNSFVT